ncbi:NAD(P)/FAD-dependent oxidoreductase [Chelativorans sp. SCAU2101]|jgi:NADH dehydrogenase, FAD-containing subunit|uniref:NAD(P)/FAD-dependent oxidoreductase n=1 Tax=Chelativorans petroleitrophicus TaxID=2975484 RepID=A0A9X2XAZ3_9HYPH|nr:NAD(P)/FAD-dependent oxidoreductase [Chelativorans petroleitrophicus]MCT8991364.1 NAD(P)/FAD-dependent oxidoreductase [Chelativorans petroleitrophicus]
MNQEGTVAAQPRAPRIVIVGGGFAGLEVAKALGRAGLPAVMLDRQNHHLFQPLLYQVATAALSATDVAEPIRKVLRRYESVQVLLGEVSEIDTARNTLRLADGLVLGYDYLVLATGAGHSYFGHDDWAERAPGLKTLGDARRIRALALLAFERAERAIEPDEQARLMTIAIVGGGPTGVELAGSLAELRRYTLARDFRSARPEAAKIMLIEAGPRILPAFLPETSDYARRRLEKLGVDVFTGTPVEDIGEDTITFAGHTVPVGVVLWAAGVAASPLGAQLGAPTDRAGRVMVDECLRAQGLSNVFVLGDAAAFTDPAGKPLPGLAQVAKQQGIHLGQGLARHIRTGAPLEPFEYRSRGNTAIIGRHAAVFERERLRLKGWIAWLAWAIIHVYLLVGFQHRMMVSLQWLWRYLTFERGARVMTEESFDVRTARLPTRTRTSGK